MNFACIVYFDTLEDAEKMRKQVQRSIDLKARIQGPTAAILLDTIAKAGAAKVPCLKVREAYHTRLPWGIERTKSNNWIGPLRQDGSGKVAEIAFSNDRDDDLTADAIIRADADADLVVHGVNALLAKEAA